MVTWFLFAFFFFFSTFKTIVACILDMIGPNDDIPSTTLSEKRKKKMTSDIWHLTSDTNTWHLTPDIWHLTWRVNILLKFQVPSSNDLGFRRSWRFGGKDDSMNQWMNSLWIHYESVSEVVVEQPWLHWVC